MPQGTQNLVNLPRLFTRFDSFNKTEWLFLPSFSNRTLHWACSFGRKNTVHSQKSRSSNQISLNQVSDCPLCVNFQLIRPYKLIKTLSTTSWQLTNLRTRYGETSLSYIDVWVGRKENFVRVGDTQAAMQGHTFQGSLMKQVSIRRLGERNYSSLTLQNASLRRETTDVYG